MKNQDKSEFGFFQVLLNYKIGSWLIYEISQGSDWKMSDNWCTITSFVKTSENRQFMIHRQSISDVYRKHFDYVCRLMMDDVRKIGNRCKQFLIDDGLLTLLMWLYHHVNCSFMKKKKWAVRMNLTEHEHYWDESFLHNFASLFVKFWLHNADDVITQPCI